MNGMKIMCMKFEHRVFVDSVSFLPLALRKLPEAFGLSSYKSWYPHNFNTRENIEYVGSMPAVSMYGVNQMSESERNEFLEWYESQKGKRFNNKRVLESHCQDDVTVLRQACMLFRREFMKIANIDVFQESITIASACNKVFRKMFLKPGCIGLIPKGGCSGNGRYSKKSIMWMLYKEQTDGCSIIHDREVRLPELPHLRVGGFCNETRKVRIS
jgi:hypothetical protein